MIVVKVWCLPIQEEAVLGQLRKKIVAGMISISLLGIEKEDDFFCFFPPNSMKHGLGNEIFVEIDGISDIPSKNTTVRVDVSQTIGKIVSAFYPKAKVVSSARGYNPNDQVWDSIKGFGKIY